MRPLQHVVIRVALALDLRRQAVEALRAAVGAREDQIPERTRNPAVAVVERMERDEPQMGKAGADQQGLGRCGIEPREKAPDLAGDARGGRRLEMHALPADRPGHDLHRPGRVRAPAADRDPRHPRVAGREQRRMPPEQTGVRDRRRRMGRRVQHHVDHALDMTIDRRQRADIDAEPARDRRPDRRDVQAFALDGARLDDIFRQRGEAGLVARRQADVRQPPGQHALRTADVGEGRRQCGEVEAPCGPVGRLPDVGVISAHDAEIISPIHRTTQYSPQIMRRISPSFPASLPVTAPARLRPSPPAQPRRAVPRETR